ncbi:hypothetical protein FO519_003684 [Halicephalobus sp. NKZ332]|nr:hypothetical protein FO519_003684 [Halicephalobus sp. NKZ332]
MDPGGRGYRSNPQNDRIVYPDSDMPQLQREDRKPVLIPISGSRPTAIDYPMYSYESGPGTQVMIEQVPHHGYTASVRVVQPPKPVFTSVNSNFSWNKKPIKPRRIQSGRRKPCNCTRSQCLKLYCECFANGEFCLDCNCKDCHNNLEYNHDRSRAIKQSLEKNPNAFKPKIGVANKGRNADMERLHQKGCHCKKSNCLKNYCECFEAKVACTERCKCCSCRNTEADRQVRFSDRFTAASDLERRSPVSDDELIERLTARDHKTKVWYYLTDDVVEATTMCLFAQANESEQRGDEHAEVVKSLFFEFGKCMNQVFDATRQAEKAVIMAAKQDFPLLDDETDDEGAGIKSEL